MDDKKIVGTRCFFQIEHICSFGTVIAVDHDGQRLFIRGDDGVRYQRWIKDVVLL